jgi:hypothetical protein
MRTHKWICIPAIQNEAQIDGFNVSTPSDTVLYRGKFSRGCDISSFSDVRGGQSMIYLSSQFLYDQTAVLITILSLLLFFAVAGPKVWLHSSRYCHWYCRRYLILSPISVRYWFRMKNCANIFHVYYCGNSSNKVVGASNWWSCSWWGSKCCNGTLSLSLSLSVTFHIHQW